MAEVASSSAGVCAAAGTVDTRMSASGAWTVARSPSRSTRTTGWWRPREAMSTVSCARPGSRTSSVTERQPSSPSASTTEAAVAPPPSTSARSTGASVASRTAAIAPGTSVFRPCRPPGSSSTVFAAPDSSAHGSREVSSGITSRFSGMVSDSPRHDSSSPSRNAVSPPLGTRTASYVQSSPSAA
jgi:hypothetical protein